MYTKKLLTLGKRIHLMAPCSALQWDLLEGTHTLESDLFYSPRPLLIWRGKRTNLSAHLIHVSSNAGALHILILLIPLIVL